jgi:hypothetical protein
MAKDFLVLSRRWSEKHHLARVKVPPVEELRNSPEVSKAIVTPAMNRLMIHHFVQPDQKRLLV